MLKTKKSADSIDSRSEAPKGLTPFPFQLDALAYASRRLAIHRAVYIAADPGLGKTIDAILITREFRKQGKRRVLYICPPSLQSNVKAEFEKWGIPSVVIVPDTQLAKRPPSKADLIFVDEAHRFKNEKSKRAKDLFRVTSRCQKIVFLSGTPLPNSRPIELWPILKHFAPDVFGTDFFPYARKFCGAHKTQWGWKFDGFTNKQMFRERLFKSFMLRQKKSLIDLPERREGLLTIGDGIPPIIGALEAKVLRAYSKEDLIEGRLAAREGKAALHLSEYLRLLGVEKLKYFGSFLEWILKETKENILIFAHHKSCVDKLERMVKALGHQPIVISGRTPVQARHAMVESYQAGKTRVGILNIVAGGIGWNLTRCDRILVVEPSWRDGDNKQAGDRAHRIGRKNPVLIQYVVLKDSFDAHRMGLVLRKAQAAV